MKPDQLLVAEKEPFARVEPPCPYFGTCGGCALQDLAYTDQLELKQKRLLRVLGTLDPSVTVELIPLEDPWRYRNKAELTFGEAQGRLILGYHAARSFWRIVDIDDCLLLPEEIAPLVQDLRRAAQQTQQPPYNPRTHQGFFRYLIVRISQATHNVMLCLVTTPGDRPVIERIAREVLERHPRIRSFYWGLNAKVADAAIPDELFLIEGMPYLTDRLGPFELRLHPLNFLQPTPVQAERMYSQMAECVSSFPGRIAWDLYCGIGLIAFYLSPKFQTVYAVDFDARNLEMAQVNASLNGITNVQYHLGKAEGLLANKRFWLLEAKPEVVVVDPPRSGLHPRVVSGLLAARPKQILYLSCNPQALVRDAHVLCAGFPRYRLVRCVAFDLFPHTNHIEVLAVLERF